MYSFVLIPVYTEVCFWFIKLSVSQHWFVLIIIMSGPSSMTHTLWGPVHWGERWLPSACVQEQYLMEMDHILIIFSMLINWHEYSMEYHLFCQGSFWVWAQPMGGGIKFCLSLAKSIPRMIPVNLTLNWVYLFGVAWKGLQYVNKKLILLFHYLFTVICNIFMILVQFIAKST